ncbi:hypothetical protein HC891_16400 [Candidatus Gracilibacteria bacterium]|nr:hypothetical protein [Candidatus Gracilibacteria bacterium]
MAENPPPFAELPSTPAVPPPPVPAPKKRGPLPRIAAGCLGVIVLGCALVGGFAFYEIYQQEQNYNAGHAAYLQADCATAVGPLSAAASGNPGSADSDVAFMAQAELQECEALQAAETLAGQAPGDAVVSFSDFTIKYASSPLNAAAFSQGQALVNATAPDQLISGNFCQAFDGLVSQQFISSTSEQIPQLLFACGQAYEGAQNFADALFFYDRSQRVPRQQSRPLRSRRLMYALRWPRRSDGRWIAAGAASGWQRRCGRAGACDHSERLHRAFADDLQRARGACRGTGALRRL